MLIRSLFILASTVLISSSVWADENLFGYVRGAETLPAGHWEFYQIFTSRTDKGHGTYNALDSKTEVEYGFTDRFSGEVAVKAQSIETKDLLVDAYIPKDEGYGLRPSGIELAVKYNFLSAAKDDLGLATYFAIDQNWLDMHSGQKKDKTSMELELLLQKYFMEGEMIGVLNFGMEATRAKRDTIDDLPTDFEWPTVVEMEVELKTGAGLTYRFQPNWFAGAEVLYETEYETEVDQERWSLFAGPSLHYGSEKWWATLTWLRQMRGGGETFEDQDDDRLHLIEKTKQEIRLKIGLNF